MNRPRFKTSRKKIAVTPVILDKDECLKLARNIFMLYLERVEIPKFRNN